MKYKLKNKEIIKAQGGLGKAAKSMFKAVRSAEEPVIKLVEPLKFNSDVKLLQQNIFKEVVKRAGSPVLGRIGKSPLGGSELFKAMLNGTYVAPPPHTYGGLKLNPNYYYRRGWGIIDDALDIGAIRVPESGYIEKALKKYPWLDNGNPFSTTLMGQNFPYFSEGELWPAGGKFGVEPEDHIINHQNLMEELHH